MIGAGYHTHYPFLAAALAARPSGPVLELGAGDWSTVMLHYMCEAQRRRLLTVDSNANWVGKFDYLQSTSHEIKVIADWTEMFDPYGADRWAVVFVDCAPPEARGKLIQRLRPKTDLFVLHDTEPPPPPHTSSDPYGYNAALQTFQYRQDFKIVMPWTTLVSDVGPIW